MKPKPMTIAGIALLLAVAVAPSAVGHDERAFVCPTPPCHSSGVSGRYVGASIAGAFPFVPAMRCDAEVVIDGNTASQGGEANEKKVDGVNTVGTNENFWDDGGQGGACHAIHYTTPAFNTAGCQSGMKARGSNALGIPWIGAACDWKEVQGGVPSEQTLLLCLFKEALAFNPLAVLGPPTPDLGGLLVQVQPLVGCVVDFANCLFDPGCGLFGRVEICGADGIPDAVDFGFGIATFPSASGVTNGSPPVNTPCLPAVSEVASIFVFDTPLAGISSASAGEVWTEA